MGTDELIRRLRFAATAGKALKGLEAEPLAAFLGNPWTRSFSGRPHLTVREYADLVVELANTGRIALPKVLALVAGAHLVDDPPESPTGFIDDALRNEVGAVLARIATDHKHEARRIALELRAKLEGRVAALPSFDKTGALTHRYLAIETPDAIYFGLALLCGSRLAADLCQCKFRECGRFFFAEREHVQGRLRRKYCTEAHRTDEHRLQAAHRIREFRKRIRARKAK